MFYMNPSQRTKSISRVGLSYYFFYVLILTFTINIFQKSLVYFEINLRYLKSYKKRRY